MNTSKAPNTFRNLQSLLPRRQSILRLLAFVCICSLLATPTTLAQQISARVSTDKTYVGAPIILQLRINDAKKYSLPDDFEVAGCDVRMAGSPSHSSQISIINGRRYQRQSVTIQYSINPKRPGKFEIPRLTLTVDGKTVNTKPMTFEAEKSENDDLLFVEVLGKSEKVYVGQPLDLTLKIWLKPFSDKKNKINLNAGQMWQSISETTNWGAFKNRIDDLRQQRSRPAATRSTRINDGGQDTPYFVFEVDTTIYPTKPGKIDASDLQVVVNYPVALGQSRDAFARDPFESLLGGRSPFGGLMDDDFFGSPFRSRLRITQSRPISANAKVDSTQVLPIPETGKPVTYRGAVGQYRMIAQAEPKTVDAGDPITLTLGIVGNGPMELVQAPPLASIETLTKDFSVVDQSLAGYVQNNTKAFVTTIRPRNKNVSQIPALPFSFFDPETESFKTVYTEPISITVNESETLSMDSIVGNSSGTNGQSSQSVDNSTRTDNFQNATSPEILQSTPVPQRFPWRYFAVIPPVVCFCGFLIKFALKTNSLANPFGSPLKTATSRIDNAQTAAEIRHAVVQFVAASGRTQVANEIQSAGRLRMLGLQQQANDLESIFSALKKIESTRFASVSPSSRQDLLVNTRSNAIDLINDLAPAMKQKLRQSVQRQFTKSKRTANSLSIFLAIIPCLAPISLGDEPDQTELTRRLESLLTEANEAYRDGMEVKADAAVAKVFFENAANKYQLIIDSEIRNADLFVNLGNAHALAGNLARAKAACYRALHLAPANTRAHNLLAHVERQIDQQNPASVPSQKSWIAVCKQALSWPVRRFGQRPIAWIFACASIAFWGLILLRTLWSKRAIFRWSLVPVAFLLTTGLALLITEAQQKSIAIVLSPKIELRTADGEEFPISESIDSISGMTVQVVQQRPGWVEVQLPNQLRGWTRANNLDVIEPSG